MRWVQRTAQTGRYEIAGTAKHLIDQRRLNEGAGDAQLSDVVPHSVKPQGV
jgi:hypothetical protein